jgi:hypothetical protein
MKQPNVNKALNKLIKSGVVLQRSNKGSGRFVLRVNPTFGWRGDVPDHWRALEKLPRNQLNILTLNPRKKYS